MVVCSIADPRWIKPQHDFSKRPLRLIYFDENPLKVVLEQFCGNNQDSNQQQQEKQALQKHSVTQEDDSLILLTQIKDTAHEKNVKLAFPLQSPVDKVGEHKVSPAIHAGYAATWFGMSGAGILMTRKLLTRGRG